MYAKHILFHPPEWWWTRIHFHRLTIFFPPACLFVWCFQCKHFIWKMLCRSAYAIFHQENNIYIVMRVLIVAAQWNRYSIESRGARLGLWIPYTWKMRSVIITENILKIYKNIFEVYKSPSYLTDFTKEARVYHFTECLFGILPLFSLSGRERGRKQAYIRDIPSKNRAHFYGKYSCSFLLFIKHLRSCDWKLLHLKNDEGGLLGGKMHKRRSSSWMILVFQLNTK